MESKHIHLKYKICVSGAAETGHCAPDALEKAKILGAEVVKRGAVLVTGATTGFPLWAAMGAKEAGGLSIGFSPAASEREHVEGYKLPLDHMDVIIYTGFGYSGRNLLLTRSSDAVIIGCGRMGTLNEFTVAFEDNKPLGVLTDSGGTTNLLEEIVEKSHRSFDKLIYEHDPLRLLDRVFAMIDKEKITSA